MEKNSRKPLIAAIIAFWVLAGVVGYAVFVGFPGGEGEFAKYEDAASGVSFSYPSDMFGRMSENSWGIIASEPKAIAAPSLSVAVFEREPAELDSTYDFYKSGELRLVSEDGKVEVSRDEIIGQNAGHLVTGTYSSNYIFSFIAKNATSSAVIVIEMIVPQADAADEAAVAGFEQVFKDVVASMR